MQRILVPILLALALMLSAVPVALGQTGPAPIETGKKVGKTQAKSVVQAANDFAAAVNKGDATSAMTPNAAAQLGTSIVGPLKLMEARNVRALSDGRFRVDVSVGGWYTKFWYSNQTWVFAPMGGHYLFDGQNDLGATYIPKGKTSQIVEATLAGGQITIDHGKVEQTDVVFFHFSNQDPFVPVDVFRLHKGVKPKAGLQSKDVDAIGALFAQTGADTTQGFILTPGTYIVVPVAADSTADNVYPDPAIAPAVLKIVAPAPKVTPVAEGSSPVASPAASPSSSPSATPGK